MEDKNLPSGLHSDLMEGRTCFVCLKVSKVDKKKVCGMRIKRTNICLFAHLSFTNDGVGEFWFDSLVLHLPALSEVRVSSLLHLPQDARRR